MKLFGISRENEKIVVHEFETGKPLCLIFLFFFLSLLFYCFFPISNLFFPLLGMGWWIGE